MKQKFLYCIGIAVIALALSGCDFESMRNTPVISPNGGEFTNFVEISITCPASDWDIYYSFGRYSSPEYDGTLYTEPFTISDSKFIRVIAIEHEDRFFFEQRKSEIVTAEFIVNPALGSRGPAGGIVIYDKGNRTEGWRFIEAASSDQTDSMIWSPRISYLGSTLGGLGDGKSNTELINEQYGTTGSSSLSAAELCYELTLNGYSDWYLPSILELRLMQNYRTQLGIEDYDWYWSSSERDLDNAKVFVFSETGSELYDPKLSRNSVRAIRYF